MDWKTLLVVYLVVAARLLLPLSIPRYPLFGIISCLLLDSADQSIMEAFGVYLPGYQGYDKALDVYYLSVAYLATMRNWENLAAFQVGRVLFYLRLGGVLAFELTGMRVLLLILPNTFEVFFMYYEVIRRKGNPMRMSRGLLVVLAGIIWVTLKLPHEWWIHIARLDGSDFLKTKILGASPETAFWRAVIEAPLVTGAITIFFVLVFLAVWRLVEVRRRKRLQAGDGAGEKSGWREHWRRPESAGSLTGVEGATRGDGRTRRIAAQRARSAATVRPLVLLEKIVLVSMISVVFQQTLPGLEANGVQTALFIATAIIATDFLLRWVLRRFGARSTTRIDLLQTALANFSLVLLFQLLLPILPPHYDLRPTFLFGALITLFVTLYDLYRPVYDVRGLEAGAAQVRPDVA